MFFFSYLVSLFNKPEDQFSAWARQHGKQYALGEMRFRREIFENNLKYINSQNQKFKKGQSQFYVEANMFADLTNEQFAERYLARPVRKNTLNITATCDRVVRPVSPPASLNWTKVVTKVKNQGQCGSCWAFAATAAVQSLNAIVNSKLLNFSEQQLVDCSTQYGNNGCGGGLAQNAFKYIIDNGIALYDDYPYTAKNQICKYKPSLQAYRMTGCAIIQPNNQTQLLYAATYQPVAVGVRADEDGFRFYKGGIFDGTCGIQHNHAILLTGFGKTPSPFYECKNSWGNAWGVNGYIRLARKGDGPGQCGIQTQPTMPII